MFNQQKNEQTFITFFMHFNSQKRQILIKCKTWSNMFIYITFSFLFGHGWATAFGVEFPLTMCILFEACSEHINTITKHTYLYSAQSDAMIILNRHPIWNSIATLVVFRGSSDTYRRNYFCFFFVKIKMSEKI